VDFDYVLGEIIESELIQHKDLPYSDSIYIICDGLLEDEAKDKINLILSEATIGSDIYAGGEKIVMKVFEHKNNQLHSISLSSFKPFLAECIIKDL